MKLRFKHQQFQADATKAVVDVFNGQGNRVREYQIDPGRESRQGVIGSDFNNQLIGTANAPVELDDRIILENLRAVQRANGIAESARLEKTDGCFNLSVEMETGVGKTYTYIKTMYELNRHYGWSKFIVVVPSIAVREGVYKTFQMTAEHFAEDYNSKIKFFIYSSARLENIEHFASDNGINAMIINSQAFNAKGEAARRIRMELDEFNSRRPIDVIAAVNPILIIDEPQSVEGDKTREGLKDFKSIVTLRYSATHRKDRIFNMVYRLDALDAYNKRLVKKIAVTGINASGTTASSGFVYLERLNLSKDAPTATIRFDRKYADGIRTSIRTVGRGFNLFDKSNELDEYKDNYVVKSIDGRDNSIEFLNGLKMYAGDVVGGFDEEQLRRIQIRETIKAHLRRESQLFGMGIKVLSLFFIDEVAHYRQYDAEGWARLGDFARWFEEEYARAVEEVLSLPDLFDDGYQRYLESIPVEKTHAGYFSIDGKGKLTNSKLTNRRERTSDDISAYDLIMKDKELLLDQNPRRSPVRFIFSHSALREGWDNPNVFQICTLKQSGSDIRKRQEIGRGLRLCVNRSGERMDANALENRVHEINVLTVIAGESYDEFTRKLQSELVEAVENAEEVKNYEVEDERRNNVDVRLNRKNYALPEFRELWSRINGKTIFRVDFETEELISKAIAALNAKLDVSEIYFRVVKGELDRIESTEALRSGTAFEKKSGAVVSGKETTAASGAKYDVIGKLMSETRLTRRTVIEILRGIDKNVFDRIKINPEEFILRAARIINDEKATTIVEHITYTLTDESYGIDIFTEARLRGKSGVNVIETRDKHVYDHLIYDSKVEREFAEELEADENVTVYVKLPSTFYISTPIGKYNPDWAIVFRKESVRHIYFVAETKGSMDSMQLRLIESAKIKCAREHFKLMEARNVRYDVVNSYDELLKKIMQ